MHVSPIIFNTIHSLDTCYVYYYLYPFMHAQLQVDPMPMAYSPSIDIQNNIVTVWKHRDDQPNKCLQNNIIFSTKQ
jgi:hypothetical protein